MTARSLPFINENPNTTVPSEKSLQVGLIMQTPAWYPPTDVYETEDNIIVRVEIAGMQDEGFAIELSGRHLLIRGLRQDQPERRAYHQMEIRFGEFAIELALPSPVDSNQVEAEYADGFLRVILPKAHPRHIPIEAPSQ